MTEWTLVILTFRFHFVHTWISFPCPFCSHVLTYEKRIGEIHHHVMFDYRKLTFSLISIYVIFKQTEKFPCMAIHNFHEGDNRNKTVTI